MYPVTLNSSQMEEIIIFTVFLELICSSLEIHFWHSSGLALTMRYIESSLIVSIFAFGRGGS